VDNSKPLPDPRSSWQPEGVHGPSRVLDHAAFAWTSQGFRAPPLASALIYELHVGTFSPEGTFDGVIQKLDYLLDLGVTHVELMPVNEFSGRRGWGYDGVDLYAPHHAYGGPDGLKRLVNACHARGLAVLLDVVYNHLGPEGNYLSQFGPYFTKRYGTPWGQAVNLDGPHSHEVRRFVIDNALMWLRDYQFDGLRLDAIHALFDFSAIHFLEQLAAEVDDLEAQLGRPLVLIAESDLNDPRIVRSPEVNGYGMDAQWSDDFHHALHAVLTGERVGYYADFGRLADLAAALERVFVVAGRFSAHRQRVHGRPPIGLSGHRFLGYTQTHDQVGNRARGERLAHLVRPGRAKIAAGLLLAAPFVPMLFMGEEWGASSPFQYFTDHPPELGKLVTEGRRREFAAFGWDPERVPDPQAEETFLRSRLDWEERDREPHAGLLDWHRRLIQLRKSSLALQDGRLDRVRVRYEEQARWLVLERGAQVTLAVNLAEHAQEVPISADCPVHLLLASDETASLSDRTLRLPPDSVAILGLPVSQRSHVILSGAKDPSPGATDPSLRSG
jgi:maltooligosyltrehalose trehalohydrolase